MRESHVFSEVTFEQRMRGLQTGREKVSGKVTYEGNSFVRNDPLDNFAWPKSTFFDLEDKHIYFWNLQSVTWIEREV